MFAEERSWGQSFILDFGEPRTAKEQGRCGLLMDQSCEAVCSNVAWSSTLQATIPDQMLAFLLVEREFHWGRDPWTHEGMEQDWGGGLEVSNS